MGFLPAGGRREGKMCSAGGAPRAGGGLRFKTQAFICCRARFGSPGKSFEAGGLRRFFHRRFLLLRMLQTTFATTGLRLSCRAAPFRHPSGGIFLSAFFSIARDCGQTSARIFCSSFLQPLNLAVASLWRKKSGMLCARRR